MNTSITPLKQNEGNNSILYRFSGNTSHEFYFDLPVATRFTKAISGRDVGPEYIFESYVIKLDGKNKKGVIRHKVNKREVIIHFLSSSDYNKAAEFNKLNSDGTLQEPMRFVGHTVRELGRIDLDAGDVIFKRLLS
jgi:hypothetical protein